MLIILLTISLSHKHPHELLDSVVKERLVDSFVSTEARILRFPQSLSSVYFAKFSEFPEQLQTLNSLRSLVSGRRILQRFNSLSTTFFTAFDRLHRSTTSLLTSVNSLFSKEFSVSSAPEVGRIIEGFTGASSIDLDFLSLRSRNHSLPIKQRSHVHYIAQLPCYVHHRHRTGSRLPFRFSIYRRISARNDR